MKEIHQDDLIRSLSRLWQKHLAVTETLATLLAGRSEDATNLISRTWRPLERLKKEGIAELEYDGPVMLCRLTETGMQKKAALLAPA